MAVPVVAIGGHVLGPSGVAPDSGQITVKLSHAGSALDGAESVRVASEVTVTLGAAGLVALSLVPNDVITPSGTHYLVTYILRLPSGRSWQHAERWQLTSDDLTLDIGAVPRLDVVPGIAVTTVESVQSGVLASATASALAAAGSETAAGSSAASALTSASSAASVRASLQMPPLPVPGALQARTIGLRALLRNRRLATNDAEYFLSSPSYAGATYFGDIYGAVEAYPGLFDGAKLRESIDLWATSYVAPNVVASQWNANTLAFAYQVAGASGPVIYDTAAFFSLWIALAAERGDSTVWTTHGATATGALAYTPRDGAGLLYSNPAGWSCGLGYHDQVHLTGGLAAVSALFALAYQRVVLNCGASLQTEADAMKAAVATLRRADGYYSASTDYDIPDVLATVIMAGNGLCSASEAVESGNRLADDYRAGKISHRGGLRWMPTPEVWPVGICSTTPNTYQNGGYWLGIWVWWAAKAMLAAGRTSEATALMQDAVDEILRQHRFNGSAPWEWHLDALSGAFLYSAATGFLGGASEPAAVDRVVELPGAALSSKIVPVDSHRVEAIEVLAGASTTATLAVTAAARTHVAAADLYGNGFSAEASIAPAIALAAETWRYTDLGQKPAYPWGGYLKVALTSGSSSQPLTVRLLQRKLRVPRLVPKDMVQWSDAFGSDSITSYFRVVPANWGVVSGQLQNLKGRWGDACLAPIRLADGYVEAQVTCLSGANNFPGLCIRWKDPWNYIFVQLSTSNASVIEVVNGVSSTLGTVAEACTNGVAKYCKMSLVGTALTVTVGATSNGFTTTVTGAGLAGAMLRLSIPGIANASKWDSLVVQPVLTVQRDMNSDGLTPYTRTGTWTVSASRLRSVDTAAQLLALHADVAAQDIGVKGVFTSAAWATKKAGLVVRAVSASNCIFAVCDGTNVSVYDRNTTDTLVGTRVLAAPVSNGVDLTMQLRVVGSKITVVVNGERWTFGAPRAAVSGSAGAYVVTGASAAEVSYLTLRVDGYTADDQPVPVGYVMDGGAFIAGFATDDRYAGLLDDVVLRDDSGAPVASLADSDDVTVGY